MGVGPDQDRRPLPPEHRRRLRGDRRSPSPSLGTAVALGAWSSYWATWAHMWNATVRDASPFDPQRLLGLAPLGLTAGVLLGPCSRSPSTTATSMRPRGITVRSAPGDGPGHKPSARWRTWTFRLRRIGRFSASDSTARSAAGISTDEADRSSLRPRMSGSDKPLSSARPAAARRSPRLPSRASCCASDGTCTGSTGRPTPTPGEPSSQPRRPLASTREMARRGRSTDGEADRRRWSTACSSRRTSPSPTTRALPERSCVRRSAMRHRDRSQSSSTGSTRSS